MAGAIAILGVPDHLLVRVAALSQVLNGVLLPFVLVFMLLLVNNPTLMGRYIDRRTYSYVAWRSTIVIIGLTGFMLYTQVKS